MERFLPPVTVKSVPVNRGLRGIDGLRGTAGLRGNRGLLVAVELAPRFSTEALSALIASRRVSIADFLELIRRITPARCCCAAEQAPNLVNAAFGFLSFTQTEKITFKNFGPHHRPHV